MSPRDKKACERIDRQVQHLTGLRRVMELKRLVMGYLYTAPTSSASISDGGLPSTPEEAQ